MKDGEKDDSYWVKIDRRDTDIAETDRQFQIEYHRIDHNQLQYDHKKRSPIDCYDVEPGYSGRRSEMCQDSIRSRNSEHRHRK